MYSDNMRTDSGQPVANHTQARQGMPGQSKDDQDKVAAREGLAQEPKRKPGRPRKQVG